MADLTLTRLAVRAALALPTPILRALSGGAAVVRGGRTLDPRFQFMLHAALPGLSGPPGAVEEERARAQRGAALVAGEPDPSVQTEDLTITGPDGAGLALRAYRPARPAPAAPLLVYGHAGAGVVGDLSSCHVACSVIAGVAGCTVLSVDYRLAPEHRFPAAIEDMAAAWRWACDQAERFGARPGAAAIGGESRGANFAAVLCQELKRLGAPQPALQLLLYPPLDIAAEPAAMSIYDGGQFATRERAQWAQDHYLGTAADPADPRLSPLRSADLSGLAPAVIATAGFDRLVGEGEAYARALQAAGVDVTYRCYDSLPHGFATYGVVPPARAALLQVARLVRQTMERNAAPPDRP
jgi:acetyl esterase/lipase